MRNRFSNRIPRPTSAPTRTTQAQGGNIQGGRTSQGVARGTNAPRPRMRALPQFGTRGTGVQAHLPQNVAINQPRVATPINRTTFDFEDQLATEQQKQQVATLANALKSLVYLWASQRVEENLVNASINRTIQCSDLGRVDIGRPARNISDLVRAHDRNPLFSFSSVPTNPRNIILGRSRRDGGQSVYTRCQIALDKANEVLSAVANNTVTKVAVPTILRNLTLTYGQLVQALSSHQTGMYTVQSAEQVVRQRVLDTCGIDLPSANRIFR